MRARKFSRARTMFRATMGNSSILSYPPPLFPTKLSFLPEQAFHGIVLSQAPALRPACISSAHFRAHTSHSLTAFRRADDGREHIGVGGQGAARCGARGRSGGGRGQLRSKIREPPAHRTSPRSTSTTPSPPMPSQASTQRLCLVSLTPASGELFSLASLGIYFVY